MGVSREYCIHIAGDENEEIAVFNFLPSAIPVVYYQCMFSRFISNIQLIRIVYGRTVRL